MAKGPGVEVALSGSASRCAWCFASESVPGFPICVMTFPNHTTGPLNEIMAHGIRSAEPGAKSAFSVNARCSYFVCINAEFSRAPM